MSKFWNPEWERESIVITGTPSIDELAQAVANAPFAPPPGFEPLSCSRNGISRMAAVGPDYTILIPAVNRVKAAAIQERIGRLTWYFICTRPTVTAIADECAINDGKVNLGFEIALDDGSTTTQSHVLQKTPNTADIGVSDDGRSLLVRSMEGNEVEQDAALVAQELAAAEDWTPSLFDLEIRYIGRARGQLAESCALDRLESHEKYQAVLEEVMGLPHRNRDVWLVLASGTTINIATASSNPKADRKKAAVADARARRLLKKNDRIDLVEALLINHFKPDMNDHHVGDLDLQGKILQTCRKAKLTGVTLAFSTRDLKISLYTARRPKQVDHALTVCL